MVSQPPCYGKGWMSDPRSHRASHTPIYFNEKRKQAMKPQKDHGSARVCGVKTPTTLGNRSHLPTTVSRAWKGGINKLPQFLFVIALTVTLALTAAAQTASFQGLGQMPGGWPPAGTYASAISGDGSTIMG